MSKISFSVCMSVYERDRAEYFGIAVESIYHRQTLKPDEIVLVVDGPVPEDIMSEVSRLEHEIPVLKVICKKKNEGHAVARQTAIDAATHEIIAIMDSDDISKENRFELQMNYLQRHPDVAVVGGQIMEFTGEGKIVGRRNVPVDDNDIKRYMKSRCPMNHMTVMFRKSMINNIGGYIDWYCEEDYYLWIRMALAGYTFANMEEVLVDVRVDDNLYGRRGGWRYFRSELRIQRFMRDNGMINIMRMWVNVMVRFVTQVLMPKKFRALMFKSLFRQKP